MLPTLRQLQYLKLLAEHGSFSRAAQVAVRPLGADHPSREIVVAWRAASTRATEGRLLAEAFAA